MSEIPDWLTDGRIDRTMALGREMEVFLKRSEEAKALDPDAKIEPHSELLALFAAIKADYGRRRVPVGVGSA